MSKLLTYQILAINISSKKYKFVKYPFLKYNLNERRWEVPKRKRTVTIVPRGRGRVVLGFSQALTKEIESKGFVSAQVEISETSSPLLMKFNIKFFRDGRGRKVRKWEREPTNLYIALPRGTIPEAVLKSSPLERIGGASWVFWDTLCCWFPYLKRVEIGEKSKKYIGNARLKQTSRRRRLYFSGKLESLFEKVRGLELIGKSGQNCFLFVPKKECFFSSCKDCPNPHCFALHTSFPHKGGAHQTYIAAGLLFPSEIINLQGKVFRYGEWLGVEF